MNKSLRIGVLSVAVGACASLDVQADEAELLDSFNPSLGVLDGVGFDVLTGRVFVHNSFSTIHEFTPDGTEVLPTIPAPGASSNDFDLDFADEEVNIGGITVSAGTMLVTNGDDAPETLYAVDKDTGGILASVVLPTVSTVGGSYHSGRDTFYSVDFTGVDFVVEIDISDGSKLNEFDPDPLGTDPFDIFFGDIEVNQATGNLFLVSSSQDLVRELTATGEFIQDFDLELFGISDMAGAAFDDINGEIWISTTGGDVHRLSGFPVPEPGVAALLVGTWGMGFSRRRRR